MAFRSKSSCVCAMVMWKSSDSVLKGLDMVGEICRTGPEGGLD